MPEAIYVQEGRTADYTPVAAVSAGQVVQLSDGRAGVVCTDLVADELGSVHTDGIFTVAKTTSMVLLEGGRVFWDASANKAHFRTVNDKDFYIGTVAEDAASADTTVKVNLNKQQSNTLDLLNGPVLSVATGTAVAGSAGFDLPKKFGGSASMRITATSEVQCVDLLSVDRVDPASNPIAEFIVRVAANGSTSDVDFNLGLANGTSTSDADAVTEHVYFHIDGGSTNILAQSKDGTTTVAAADTTVDLSAGSAVANRNEFWIDMRDPDDIQLYIDGVLVLAATAFDLGAAVGPLGLLVHLEKATGTATAGPVYVDRAVCRTMDQ